jgi:hypothetical protein
MRWLLVCGHALSVNVECWAVLAASLLCKYAWALRLQCMPEGLLGRRQELDALRLHPYNYTQV